MNSNKIILTLTGAVNLNQYGWPEIAGIDLRDIVVAAAKTGKAIRAELTLRSTDEPAPACEEEVRS